MTKETRAANIDKAKCQISRGAEKSVSKDHDTLRGDSLPAGLGAVTSGKKKSSEPNKP